MRHVTASLALGVLLAASTAVAQPSTNDKTLADQLFQQGRDFAKASDWARACPKFEASLKYDPAIGTKLNLATCYEWIGKPASAWGLYREVIEETTRTHDAKRLAIAKQAAAKLEPTLPRLAIIAPIRPPPGLVIERDGVVIAPAELGTPIFVDPGPHHVTALAPNYVTFDRDVEAVAAKTVTAPIPQLAPAPVVAVPPVVGSTRGPVDRDPASTSHRRLIGATVGVGGLALVGVGLVFGAKASGKLSDAQALCDADLVCDPADLAGAQALVHDSRSAATVSTVFVIAGGVAIAGGLVLYLTAPSRTRESIAIVPVVSPTDASIVAWGRF